jgi:hypothetical protein
MQSIWVAVHPRPLETRILATLGSQEMLLRGSLSPYPAHPRALPWLLEALALWQGVPVRAALAADESAPSSVPSLFHDLFADFGSTPLYTLESVAPVRFSERAMARGDFRDLHAFLVREVAR